MTWVPLDIAIIADDLWPDLWAARLWFWLLCRAKTATVPGVVLFGYPVVADQLAVVDCRKHREPSRKSLRHALQKLVAMGRVSVREWEQGWEQARDVGGAQGYLTVRLSEWPPCGVGGSSSGTGSETRSGTGSGGDRAAKGYTKKREREKKEIPTESPLSESKDASDVVTRFRGQWNREVAGHNVRALRPRPRDRELPRRIRAFVADCEGDWDLVDAAIRAYAQQPFHQERTVATRLGVDTFLRPAHRGDYVERGRDLLEEGRAGPLDTAERRARAADDLACEVDDLTFDPSTGGYARRREETR